MKPYLLLLAPFALLAAAVFPSSTPVETMQPKADVVPPVEYQGPVVAEVSFASPEDVNAACFAGSGRAPQRGEILWACSQRGGLTGAGWMLAPNPCLYASKEKFAKIMCHEQGHLNGWHHDG